MKLLKLTLILFSIAAIVILGSYISGWFILLLLGINNIQLSITTAYYFLYYFSADPTYGNTIIYASIAGYAIILIVISLIIILFKLKNRTKNIHGNARFASATELAKKGLFKASDTAVVVGKKNGKFLFLNGQQFVLLAAPTRSGKGVGIVIPNLLSYKESIVVLDIKQENFNLTSGFRKKYGQDVFLFNPFAEDRITHCWNPLSYVSKDLAFRVSDLQSIAAMLYPDGIDEQKFWASHARNTFLAIALYAFETNDHKNKFSTNPELVPTLGRIYRLASGDGTDLKKYFHALIDVDYISETTKTAFATLLSQADETFSSIIGTFKEPLNSWINPVVDMATSSDDFLLTDVRKKRITIYVVIQPNKLSESKLIINLFFSQLINLNTKELPQDNPELKHQCLLLLDEFTSIGRIDIIAQAVSYMSGYNIRLFPIIQSVAQLDATYGKELSRNIITNHAMQILYTPREQQDANDYSEMLGYRSIKKESISRGKDVSYTENDEKRALMLPQELKAMSTDKEILIYEGLSNPVSCDKIRYYKEGLFKSRVLPRITISKINLV